MAQRGLRKTERVMPWGWLAMAFPALVVWGYYDTKRDVDLLAEGQRIIYSNQIELMQELEEQRRLAPRGPAIEIVPEQAAEIRKIAQPPAPANRLMVVRTKNKIAHRDIDVFCMAKNIFHEAGVEDRLGKYAVAQVTLNRMKSARYPDSICHVVMDPFQFSWANDRSIRWTRPSGRLWEESRRVAEDVVRGGARVKGLESALFYHADYVSPRWRNPEAKLAKVGTHIFYASAK